MLVFSRGLIRASGPQVSIKAGLLHVMDYANVFDFQNTSPVPECIANYFSGDIYVYEVLHSSR